MSFFGILNLNKPAGITSRTAVDRIVALAGRGTKAGHAGTLDPLASGVLIVCLGPATRLIEYVQQMPKRYRGTFLLGRTSDTEDVEGTVTELANPPVPDRAAIDAATAAMVGVIQQRPPAYSALKVAGRRAYKLARQGKQPVLAPRPVTIHSLQVVEYDYPRLTLDIRCGSGTYVRSLGRDLAERLGTGAVMAELTRTEIGDFAVEDACSLADLTVENLSTCLLPPNRAVAALPNVELTDAQLAHVVAGRAIQLSPPAHAGADIAAPDAAPTPATPAEVAALDALGRVVAILSPRGDGLWRPARVLYEAAAAVG